MRDSMTVNEATDRNINLSRQFNFGLSIANTPYTHTCCNISLTVSVALGASRCAEYFRDERARRGYRNMRVKRTLPPRTTVVERARMRGKT